MVATSTLLPTLAVITLIVSGHQQVAADDPNLLQAVATGAAQDKVLSGVQQPPVSCRKDFSACWTYGMVFAEKLLRFAGLRIFRPLCPCDPYDDPYC